MADDTQKQTVTLEELMMNKSGDGRCYGKALDPEGCLYRRGV
jgi:hypothetical protein